MALEPHELELFHPLCIALHKRDLDLLESLLLLAEFGASEQDVLDHVDAEILRTQSWYEEFNTQVDQAYKMVGLIYDAVENPFIC